MANLLAMQFSSLSLSQYNFSNVSLILLVSKPSKWDVIFISLGDKLADVPAGFSSVALRSLHLFFPRQFRFFLLKVTKIPTYL